MKKLWLILQINNRTSSLLILILISCNVAQSQNVGIGTTTPDAKALLDISSTTKGVLFPRMTTTQRASIQSPPAGLLVYDTDRKTFFHFDGAIWRILINSDYWNRLSTLPNYISNSTDSVAIGALIPEERLDVNGNIRSRNNLIAANNVLATGNINGGGLTTSGNLFTVGTSFLGGDITTNSAITINNTTAILQLKSSSDNKGFLQLNGNDLRFGTNSGNVSGNVVLRMDGDDLVSFEKINDGAYIRLKREGLNIGVLQATSAGNLTITNPSGGTVGIGGEIFVNDIGDKTGIGTSNPTATLDVNGNTKINGTATINGNTTIYNNLSAYKTSLASLQIAGGEVAEGYNGLIAVGRDAYASGFNSMAIGSEIFINVDQAVGIGSNVTINSYGTMALTDGKQGSTAWFNTVTDNRMYMRFDGGYRLWTDQDHSTGALMNHGSNGWSSVSDSTKKENFVYANGGHFLQKIGRMKLGSWNYKTQDKKTFRHYGPMAQEFYTNFGNDGIGNIGDDTTIASTDIDGVMMIALQALIKENNDLKMAAKKQAEEINVLQNRDELLLRRLEKMEAILDKKMLMAGH